MSGLPWKLFQTEPSSADKWKRARLVRLEEQSLVFCVQITLPYGEVFEESMLRSWLTEHVPICRQWDMSHLCWRLLKRFQSGEGLQIRVLVALAARKLTANSEVDAVLPADFALLARAEEFCSSQQSSFVWLCHQNHVLHELVYVDGVLEGWFQEQIPAEMNAVQWCQERRRSLPEWLRSDMAWQHVRHWELSEIQTVESDRWNLNELVEWKWLDDFNLLSPAERFALEEKRDSRRALRNVLVASCLSILLGLGAWQYLQQMIQSLSRQEQEVAGTLALQDSLSQGQKRTDSILEVLDQQGAWVQRRENLMHFLSDLDSLLGARAWITHLKMENAGGLPRQGYRYEMQIYTQSWDHAEAMEKAFSSYSAFVQVKRLRRHPQKKGILLRMEVIQ